MKYINEVKRMQQLAGINEIKVNPVKRYLPLVIDFEGDEIIDTDLVEKILDKEYPGDPNIGEFIENIGYYDLEDIQRYKQYTKKDLINDFINFGEEQDDEGYWDDDDE